MYAVVNGTTMNMSLFLSRYMIKRITTMVIDRIDMIKYDKFHSIFIPSCRTCRKFFEKENLCINNKV